MKQLFPALVALAVTISGAAAQAPSSPEPTAGWSLTEVTGLLEAAGLEEVAVSTDDPNLPTVTGRTADGFPVQGLLSACPALPPDPEDRCGGLQLSVAMISTERRWAEKIVDSLERGVIGFNAHLIEARLKGGEEGFAVLIGHYIVADQGVSPDLPLSYLQTLLGLTAQTRDFMLSDDPAHAELWDRN